MPASSRSVRSRSAFFSGELSQSGSKLHEGPSTSAILQLNPSVCWQGQRASLLHKLFLLLASLLKKWQSSGSYAPHGESFQIQRLQPDFAWHADEDVIMAVLQH